MIEALEDFLVESQREELELALWNAPYIDIYVLARNVELSRQGFHVHPAQVVASCAPNVFREDFFHRNSSLFQA